MSTVVCSLYAPTPVTTSVVVVRRVASPLTACLGHVQVGGDRAPVRQAGELRGWMPWCGRSHGSPSCKVGQGGQPVAQLISALSGDQRASIASLVDLVAVTIAAMSTHPGPASSVPPGRGAVAEQILTLRTQAVPVLNSI